MHLRTAVVAAHSSSLIHLRHPSPHSSQTFPFSAVWAGQLDTHLPSESFFRVSPEHVMQFFFSNQQEPHEESQVILSAALAGSAPAESQFNKLEGHTAQVVLERKVPRGHLRKHLPMF